MNYVGGKAQIAAWTAEFIRALSVGGRTYLEPFVGSGATFVRHAPYFPRAIAADGHPDLILMWKALAEGWVPPEQLSREEYRALRHAEPSALRALAGFGASFRGKWFGGFDGRENLPDRPNAAFATSRASAMKKVPSFVRAEIVHASYEEHAPGAGWIVYCDPPYAGTLGYAGGASFDSAEFWKVARSWADAGALVVVSEQEAPEDWEAIAGRTRKANFRLAVGEENEVRQERLFMRPEQIPRWLR